MRYAIIALAAVAVMMPAQRARAADVYYLEVGGDSGKDEAMKHWQELVAKHKAMLSHLKVFPKDIMQGGNAVSTRIQAGPLDNKDRAQKICNRLFRDNTPCFVIEGLGDAPPTKVISLTEQAGSPATLPWLAEKSVEVADAPAPAAPAEQNAAAPVDGTKGKVEVAEAIRVPLSQGESVSVRDLPESQIHKRGGPVALSSDAADSGPGWLAVESFSDEESAEVFWQEARNAAADKTSGLRARIVQPLSRRGTVTVLNVGPFASSTDANAFCIDGVQAIDKSLRCGFDTSITDTADASQPGSRGDAYETRRKSFAMQHQRPAGNADAAPQRRYWVQVISAESEMEALHQWEDIRTSNGDLLQGRRSSVSAPLTSDGRYSVRIGPLANNGDAAGLCKNLRDRKIDCRVLLYSSGT